MNVLSSFLKIVQLLVCVKLSTLLFGCQRDYPPTVSYSVSGTIHDPLGVSLKPSQFDIMILDYENTKPFNGGRYSLGTRLTVDALGKFSGSFNGPSQPCEMASFQFIIVSYDSLQKKWQQPMVIDSTSRITCQETVLGTKSVTFDLTATVP